MNELTNDTLGALAKAPHAVWGILVMFFFGIAWKRSGMDNKWLKYLQWGLPIILYPAAELSISNVPWQRFYNPYIALGIAGFMIAIFNLALHETTVYFLKTKFPWLKWNGDTPVPPTAPETTEPK